MIQSQVKVPWPGWQISDYLGGGSFGAVYKIQREIFDGNEYAAMKVIPVPKERGEIRELLNNGYDQYSVHLRYKEDLENIKKEYSIMARLRGNSNIVYGDEFCSEPNPDGIGWLLYIRMELLTPLKQVLTEACSEAQVIKVGMDLCNALIACKRKNIIHRDIKPENIMVAEDGNCKLGDFGVAKIREGTSGGTKTGTFNYMAPEIYNNRPYGPSSDLYSLGMVMYWMLNRRCGPFLPLPPTVPTASQMDSARDRRFSGEALPPPVDGSQALHKIVLRACAYDPAQRYSTPEELKKELEEYYATLPKGSSSPVFFERSPKDVPGGGKGSWSGEDDTTARTGDGSYRRFGTVVDTPNDSHQAVVIKERMAKKGGPKTVTLKNGEIKTIHIPTGCKNGQVVDGVKVYVHRFNLKMKNMEELPDEVLEVYASAPYRVLRYILGFLVYPVGVPYAIIWTRKVNKAARILKSRNGQRKGSGS